MVSLSAELGLQRFGLQKHGTIQSIGSICRIDAESDFKEAKATILRKLELQLVSDIGEEYISKYSAGQANQT